jgi:hypothetical protein
MLPEPAAKRVEGLNLVLEPLWGCGGCERTATSSTTRSLSRDRVVEIDESVTDQNMPPVLATEPCHIRDAWRVLSVWNYLRQPQICGR